ncbi:MAG: ATP-binding cassette domain-containing protein, partial [Clostridioides difficile]|nr:ATP-binding cassette domain-containing protein [Clostridioides difficile]
MRNLSMKGIRKIYGENENKVNALNGIDLEINPHKFTAIIGASGSGKSTLLHCMAGLDKPTSGHIYLDDIDIYTMDDTKLSRIRREEFGFIFQSFNLIPVIKVYENIIMPVSLGCEKIDKKYIDMLIDKLGLREHINKYPNQLSGGQQQ